MTAPASTAATAASVPRERAARRARPRVSVGRIALLTFTGLVLLYLVFPVFIVAPLSFSSAKYLQFPPPGLSLQWYQSYFGRADWIAAVVLHLRKRVTNHSIEVLQPQFGAVRQRRHFERAGQDANQLGPLPEHFSERPRDIAALAGQRKDPVRFLVHQRQGPVAMNRDHPVAHAAYQLPKKTVVGRRSAMRNGAQPRGSRSN